MIERLLRNEAYEGYLANSVIDIGLVESIRPIVNEDEFSQVSKNSEKYELLSRISKGRYTYLLTVQKITGTSGVLTDVPFAFSTLGQVGAANGGIPTPGQMVIILYVGDRKIPYAIGGNPFYFVDTIARGYLPPLKPGEQIIQSEISQDPFNPDEKKRQPGARVWLDYKGRLHLQSVQNDGTINGTVKITLGAPIEDELTDEDNSFIYKDDATGQEIVFRLETASGVAINIDKDGNVHSSILKDFIKECVNEELTLSGNRTETIAGNEDKTVDGKYSLTCTDINLGRTNPDQSLVLGEVLLDKLSTFIDIMVNSRHLTNQGPTISLFPAQQTQLNQLKNSLEEFLSHIARTQRE